MKHANRSYFGSAVSVAVSNGLSAAGGFAALAVLTRILSKEDLGGYVVAYSLVSLAAVISVWGFERSLVLQIAAYPAEPEDMRGRQLMLRTCAVAASIGLIAGTAMAVSADKMVALGLIPQVASWLPWLVLAPATIAVSALLQAWFRANHRVEISSLMAGVNDAARAALFALVLIAGLGLPSIAIAVVLSAALPILILGWAARGTRDREPFTIGAAELSSGALVAIANLSRFGLRSFDVVAVGLLADGVTTAIYAVAARLAMFCQMGAEALQPAFSPRVRRHFTSGDLDSAERELHHALVTALLVTFGVAGVLILSAPLLLDLLGGFDAAITPLIILIAGYVLSSGAGLLFSFMNMSGEIRGTTLVRVASIPVFFLFVALLVPRFGESGAAAALALALAVMMVVLLLYVRIRLEIVATTWSMTTLTLAGVTLLFASAAGEVGTRAAGAGLLGLIPIALIVDRNARNLPRALLRLMRGEP